MIIGSNGHAVCGGLVFLLIGVHAWLQSSRESSLPAWDRGLALTISAYSSMVSTLRYRSTEYRNSGTIYSYYCTVVV